MKAVIREAYGPAEALQVADVEEPRIGDDGVLVEVRAAGLDMGVWHLMTGEPYVMRLFGFGLFTPKQPVLGLEVAGRVAAVGRLVARFRVGDEVFGTADGSFAEYAATTDDRLALQPTRVDAVASAALGVSGVTALQALRDEARVEAGEGVLVIGAAGGVGSYAVQLAKAFGAHVTGVASTAKLEFVLSLGADAVIDYTRDDLINRGRRWDVVIDLAGNRPLRDLRRILTPTGRLVIVGGEAGDRWTGGIGRWVRAALISPFVRQQLRSLRSSERDEDLTILAEHVDAGDVVPAVESTYTFGEVPRAVADLRAGRLSGKAVVVP